VVPFVVVVGKSRKKTLLFVADGIWVLRLFVSICDEDTKNSVVLEFGLSVCRSRSGMMKVIGSRTDSSHL
jgi:hypothetical protein